jgi:two-component system, LuxR family, secretion system response regulator SsrB
MHRALQPNGNGSAAIRVVVIAARRLDGESLAALLDASAEFHLLYTTTSTEDALELCRYELPDVMLCDASLADRDAWHSMVTFLRAEHCVPVMLLDDEVNLGRLAATLQLPGMGYFTRNATSWEIAFGLRRLASGERAFDAVVRDRLVQTARGWRILHARGCSPLDRLTPRERQVMRLIALGRSVRDCAQILALAHSTVDNHKTRLMKKLGIRKSQDLTRLAIREGLICI